MFIRGLFLSLIFFLSVILQSTLLEYELLAPISPNLLLVLVTFFAHFYGSLPVLIPSFLAGFVLDMLTPTHLGMHAMMYTLLCFVVGYTHQKFFQRSWTSVIALSLLAHVFQVIYLFIFIMIFRSHSLLQSFDIVELLVELLSGSIFYFLLFIISGLKQNTKTV